jgi:hypothetical protein
MNITKHRVTRAASRTVLAGAIVAAALGVADTASADSTTGGCAQGWSNYPGTCISVVTGDKNAGNHTEYVKQITVSAPRDASSPGLLEAWAGNGPSGIAWYKSANSLYITWTVNQWIKTDSGVCGSYTYPGTTTRSIACITIKA